MELKDHKDLFELVCNPALKDLKQGQGQILDILKGRNGDPGLCDHVRSLQKAYRALTGAVVFVLGILTVEGISWAWSKLFGG